MTKLTTSARNKLPAKDFALGKGHYPINDANHARNALARVSEYGTPEEKAEVRSKVHSKYPSMGDSAKEEKTEKPKKQKAYKKDSSWGM